MAAATANFPSCELCFFIVFVVGSNFVLAQDQRFRINVFDYDYPQERNENYPIGGHDDRYRSYKENNYPVDYRGNNYPQNYQPRYGKTYEEAHYQNFEPIYEKPVIKKKPKKDEQDFSKIPGVPGVDFPIYHTIPKTSFSCSKVPYLPGMYANVETGCQVYHTCHDGREGDQGAAFLCSNGTLFNQNEFACDWWYNVNCNDAIKSYKLNGDATTNPFVPKAKKEEILQERLKIVVF